MTFLTFLFKNLLRRASRSILTLLGVAVAIGAVVALRGISHGFESSFRENFEQRGVDLVIVAEGIPDQLRSDLQEGIGDQIAELEGVAEVAAGLVELVDIRRGEGLTSSLINGWRPGAPQFDDLEIVEGRAFEDSDRLVVMLGVTLAENLGKDVGDSVEIQGEPFEVVGTYRSFDVFENGGAIVPLSVLQDMMVRPDSVTGFSVALEPEDRRDVTLDEVEARIESLEDPATGKPYKIDAQPTKEYVENTIFIRLSHGMAWITSAIALVIGAISVLNTMLMAVLERTKEIGILRAVGWPPGRVVRMVLGEAMLLSIVGAIVGILAAAGVIRWLAEVPLTSGFVSGQVAPRVILEGIGLTLLVALLGGIGPALRAARLMPTEALRHE